MLTVVPMGMGSGLLGWIVDPVNPVYPVKILTLILLRTLSGRKEITINFQ